jgi:predicted naringenin-chalcone synthase
MISFKAFYTKEIAVLELKRPFVFELGWRAFVLLGGVFWYLTHRENAVYLLDFSVFDSPEDWRLSPEELLEAMKRQECFTPESLDFMDRMLKQSGVGPKTAWPPGIVRCLRNLPTLKSVEASREESETVMFDVVDKVLKKTGTKPQSVDILVINCSLFSPTPSLCSMVINKFKMRSDISSYNLSGMGCSAGLISVELVKNILASRPNSTALIVSTEIITPNLYHGNERAFLLQNTLFRCGGAAILLSNKWTDAYRAQFKLLHVMRTQFISDESFGCVYETEDPGSHRGVRLSKDIVKVAGRAMEKNFTSLGPYVLPLSEQIKTGISMLKRASVKYLNSTFKWSLPKVDPYIPDFKRGIDHFCIHAGGRGVIDGIEKNLQLNPWHVEPSRHTLYK